MNCKSIICVFLVLFATSEQLDNGLARTPPMGWLSWERFRCNTDCVNDPNNCISENLFRQMADIMETEGYLSAGYNYVIIDDCWLSRDRDNLGNLQPDPDRFPSGMNILSNYIHTLGMKFGIYEDYGSFTCAGYPGIVGHMRQDANTFANWEVDYVKLDGCYSLPIDMDMGYTTFGYFLNATGRPMIYSCSWPFYQQNANIKLDWELIKETCSLWRNFDDIGDSWNSVQSIIDYYGNNQENITPHAGPGHWNDPDMLIIGNFGLSYEQSKSQMGMWAIFAAPLLMSVDLRTIRPEYKAILLNTDVIAVNQDPMGVQGYRIYKEKLMEIWKKPVMPVHKQRHSYAIAFLNRGSEGTPSQVHVTLKSLGLSSPAGYEIRDLFKNETINKIVKPDDRLTFEVNPTGIVLIKCKVLYSL